MTSISIKANGSNIVAISDGKLTSGMVGIPVSIEYDSAWNGLIKTASFRVGKFVRSRENIGTETTVPWEVMRYSGKPLEIGVEGRDADGNIVMPTVWASVSKILPGANASVPAAPNPDGGEIPSGDCASIDDSVITTDKTWSSQKISQEIASGGSGGTVVDKNWELINAITITEENTRAAIFDDNFCLRKFILKAHFAGVSGQTTRNFTFSMMEKLDDGTYHVFYTMASLSGIVDNSPRYITVWGDMPVGAPMMLQMSRVSQYSDSTSVVETHPYPNVVEKGLTRLFFVDSDKSNLPVGSKFELWGVRV